MNLHHIGIMPLDIFPSPAQLLVPTSGTSCSPKRQSGITTSTETMPQSKSTEPLSRPRKGILKKATSDVTPPNEEYGGLQCKYTLVCPTSHRT